MLTTGRSSPFVGRVAELATLRGLVREVAAGRGRSAWIDGEPGIGKSALVAAGLAAAGKLGCATVWCAADELSQLLPLRVIMRGVEEMAGFPAGEVGDISELLQGKRTGTGVLGGIDPVTAAGERLLALVDRLCAAGPLIIVLDDLQWADEASLSAWHQLALAVDQLPLLLVATCHPAPRRAAVETVRNAISGHGGVSISLEPLGQPEAAQLVAELVGAPPGPNLRQLITIAAGNPLYLGEIMAGLQREHGLTVEATSAELVTSTEQEMPSSIGSTIARRLGVFAQPTLSMLSTAALLEHEFSVRDLAVVLGRPPAELAAELREVQAAGVLVESGSGLAFRHQLVRQVLSERMPVTLRTALHRQAAQALAGAGAGIEQVAQQLRASEAVDAWTLGWISRHVPALTRQSPELAAPLLSRAAPHVAEDDPAWQQLWSAQLEAWFQLGRYVEAEACARRLMLRSTDPAVRAEAGWLLARVLFSSGRNAEAQSLIEQALAGAGMPTRWRARMHALHTVFLRDAVGDLAAAEAAAAAALALGEQVSDTFAVGSALCVQWTIAAVRREYATALEHIDRALTVLGDDTAHPELRASALEDKIFTLENLDRLADADACLNEARSYALRTGDPRSALRIGAAVHYYWMGRWDDALAELASLAPDSPEISHFGLRERGPVLLYHGVSALIAVYRDDRAAAGEHLRAGFEAPLDTTSAWENADFLLAARALDAERRGDLAGAVSLLAPILSTRPGQMTLVHQWLPDLVRLAVAAGDASTAHAALARCESEADREQVPARAAAAALRCRGLLAADGTGLRAAADHYREVGRPVELAQTLEELAAQLAMNGDASAARAALKQATDAYAGLDAEWCLRRAYTRLHQYGIRRGVRGPRRRATSGWDALTPTELAIAYLIGEGRSNPEIAAELYLARGTVQYHVSHILAKLGVPSRIEVAREALAHPGPRRALTEAGRQG